MRVGRGGISCIIEEKRLQREEKERLLALSEKELLVEIMMELKRIERRIDDVESMM